jgi:hypothetical protein
VKIAAKIDSEDRGAWTCFNLMSKLIDRRHGDIPILKRP